jgi:hypothetical protein
MSAIRCCARPGYDQIIGFVIANGEARDAKVPQSRIMIWCACASSNRDNCTGTSSRPRGGRGMRLVSATSGAMFRRTPQSNCMRSAMAGTNSDWMRSVRRHQRQQYRDDLFS